MNENDYIYETTDDAIQSFKNFCEKSGDTALLKSCENYSDKHLKKIAGILAGKNGFKTTELILSEIQNASSGYQDRFHIKKYNEFMIRAYTEASVMKSKGFMNVRVLREEPFEHTEDTMNFSVYLIADKNSFTGIKTIVHKISDDSKEHTD